MSVGLSPIGNDAPFVNASGDPLSGGKLYIYLAGSATPATTYQDNGAITQNANPVILNSNGYPSSGGSVVEIWLTDGATYLFELKTSADVAVWSRDDIEPVNDVSVSQDEWVAGPAPTYVSGTSFTLVGDQTSTFHVGRRLKTTNSGGTIYSTITVSAYTSLTTITVANDSGSLDAGLSAVNYGLISANNTSISPQDIYKKGTAVASAGTCDIWGVVGDYIHITGSTGPITSFGTAPYAGAERTLIFDSTPTITYNGTSLILPGGISIVCAAGDRAVVRADTTANMIVTQYTRASKVAITGYALGSVQTFTASDTWTKPSGCVAVLVKIQAPGGGGGGADSDGTGAGAGGGGGGGGYSEEFITAGLGATEVITIGAVGAAGSATNGTSGGTGGTTSFGSHCQATGGVGGSGTGVTTVTTVLTFGGGGGGAGSGGTVNTIGDAGGIGFSNGGLIVTGNGGSSALGGGAVGRHITAGTLLSGNNGSNYGGGGSGALIQANATGAAGGTGGAGIIIVYEFY
mgnify:CR=1 FL=1